MSRFLIEVGTTGVFNLATPFAALLVPKTMYTCQGVRKLSEIIASGIDAFKEYYQSNGLDATAYEADLALDVTVLSLTSSEGQWVFVPDTYVLGYPDISGVTYRAIILGAAISVWPDGTDFSAVKTLISNVIRDSLGVVPVMQEVVASMPAIMPSADHELTVTARNAIKSIDKSDSAKLAEALAQIATLTAQRTALEDYIKTNLPP